MHSKPQTYYSSRRPEMRRFLPDTYSRVLEVGCGEGRFSAHLSGYSELWGVEPSGDAAMRAEQAG